MTRRRGFLPVPDASKTDRCRCDCIEGDHLICGCPCGECGGFRPALVPCDHCGVEFTEADQLDAHLADRPADCRRAERYGRKLAKAGR